MITAVEIEQFYRVANAGKSHDDPNFQVYGNMLYKYLRHYETLVMPHAKIRLEQKIRHAGRQIERRRTSF
jgi:hypothetical protein